MNAKDLHRLAKRYFIAVADLSEANLIRKIQVVEGDVDCFATGRSVCEQMACRWRKDCLPQVGDGDDVPGSDS